MRAIGILWSEVADRCARCARAISRRARALPGGAHCPAHRQRRAARFTTRPKPRTPKESTAHRCINLRLPTHGGLYAWEFEKNSRELRVRVDGQLIFNSVTPILETALNDFGIAYLMQEQVQSYLDDGRLVQVLADWSPPFSGYHLYYPSRRQPTPAFALVVEALRFRKAGPKVRVGARTR